MRWSLGRDIGDLNSVRSQIGFPGDSEIRMQACAHRDQEDEQRLHPRPRMQLRAIASVPAEHEDLEGKQQCLESQKQGVHESEGIDNVKSHTPRCAGVFG